MIMPSMPASSRRPNSSTTCSGVPTTRVPGPARDEALLELLDLLVERLALHARDLHDVARRVPVAVVDLRLEGVLGLLLGAERAEGAGERVTDRDAHRIGGRSG